MIDGFPRHVMQKVLKYFHPNVVKYSEDKTMKIVIDIDNDNFFKDYDYCIKIYLLENKKFVFNYVKNHLIYVEVKDYDIPFLNVTKITKGFESLIPQMIILYNETIKYLNDVLFDMSPLEFSNNKIIEKVYGNANKINKLSKL